MPLFAAPVRRSGERHRSAANLSNLAPREQQGGLKTCVTDEGDRELLERAAAAGPRGLPSQGPSMGPGAGGSARKEGSTRGGSNAFVKQGSGSIMGSGFYHNVPGQGQGKGGKGGKGAKKKGGWAALAAWLADHVKISYHKTQVGRRVLGWFWYRSRRLGCSWAISRVAGDVCVPTCVQGQHCVLLRRSAPCCAPVAGY